VATIVSRPETVPARLGAVSIVIAPILVIDPAIVDVPVLAIVTDPVLAPEGAVVAHVAATTAAAAEIATGAIAVVETPEVDHQTITKAESDTTMT